MSQLNPWEGLQIVFERRHIGAFFKAPCAVLSSSRVWGGLRDDIECICNHQACEPVAHGAYIPASACEAPEEYLAHIASEFGLPDKSVLLTTAANMQCAGRAVEEYADQKILAVVTAGVDGNAARAGDPASYAELPGGIAALPPGTINIMLFFNTPLEPGAMLEAAMLAAEAKSSVLQELSVASRYSKGLATGTGTDGMALAAPLPANGVFTLTNAGKHSKCGEMIARAVRRAMFESLARQNSMLLAMRCNALKLLSRFGLDEAMLLGAARELLPAEDAKLMEANLTGLVTDPHAAASAAALAHLEDQNGWGLVPSGARDDLMLFYAAIMAGCVSGKSDRLPEYHAALARLYGEFAEDAPARLAAAAIALGFGDKWK